MLFGAVALHRADRLRHAVKRSISKWTETPEWTLTRLGRMAWNIKPVMAKTCAPHWRQTPEPRLPALLALKSTRRLLVLGDLPTPSPPQVPPLFSPSKLTVLFQLINGRRVDGYHATAIDTHLQSIGLAIDADDVSNENNFVASAGSGWGIDRIGLTIGRNAYSGAPTRENLDDGRDQLNLVTDFKFPRHAMMQHGFLRHLPRIMPANKLGCGKMETNDRADQRHRGHRERSGARSATTFRAESMLFK